MKEEDLLLCQINEWYPIFHRHSIKTLILPIPQSFLHYLLQDDGPFFLPTSSAGGDPLPRHPNSSDPLFSDTTLPDDPQLGFPQLGFPDFESSVHESIKTLGGAAFPKLNWSAPTDAASIGIAGSLKCSTFPEIALLLKSSDRISHDLVDALDSCADRRDRLPREFQFFLALRKWHESLRPEMEFRCFVRHRRLVGISQREISTFYPILKEKKLEIESTIAGFFEEIVEKEFGSKDYTFDVYVTRNGSTKIVDFNPWGGYTLPLLFSWEELEERESLELRIVEDRCGVRPGLKTAVPFDYVDTAPGSGWDEFLRRVGEELREQSLGDDDDDDDDNGDE